MTNIGICCLFWSILSYPAHQAHLANVIKVLNPCNLNRPSSTFLNNLLVTLPLYNILKYLLLFIYCKYNFVGPNKNTCSCIAADGTLNKQINPHFPPMQSHSYFPLVFAALLVLFSFCNIFSSDSFS